MAKKKGRGNNIAYIDGQNLYLATRKHKISPWRVDLARLRIFLRDRYDVHKAYYYLGYVDEENQDIYDKIQEVGYILRFKEHNPFMKTKKKGNVDTEIVFDVMEYVYRNQDNTGIVLVSGDGDYKKMCDFLKTEKRLVKILFPAKNSGSSLYRKLAVKYVAALDDPATKAKVCVQDQEKRKGTLEH